MRLARRRGKDSESEVPGAKDSETRVCEGKQAVPETVRLEQETTADKVSETEVHHANSIHLMQRTRLEAAPHHPGGTGAEGAHLCWFP